MKDPINPSLVTTPLGAVIGVALTRKLVPESDRTFNKYLIGGGVGAGVGLAAGELMQGRRKGISSLGQYKDYVLGNPTSDISKEEIDFINSQRGILQGDIEGNAKKARTRAPNLKHRNALIARRQVLTEAATSEKDPTRKAKLMSIAKHLTGKIDGRTWKDRGIEVGQAVPFLGTVFGNIIDNKFR